MMRSIVESLEVFSVFPSTNKLHLLTSTVSLPVNWSALISLTSGDLFQAEFVGFTNLQQIIDNMVCVRVIANTCTCMSMCIVIL